MAMTPDNVIDLLERPVYGVTQADRVLGLRSGTVKRWVEGYARAGKQYPPIIRVEPTGEDAVTWGEFVEARLLSEYRDRGARVALMRPVIESLREKLQTKYPLASAQLWLDVDGRELVKEVQDQVKLEKTLSLVELRTGQQLIWTKPADDFQRSLEWAPANGQPAHPRLLRPFPDIEAVQVNPLRAFGEPVVRGVPTGVIAELIRAGDSPEMVATLYELPQEQVDAAVQYELRRAELQRAA